VDNGRPFSFFQNLRGGAGSKKREERRHQAGPARLMAGANPGSGVPMKVFVKKKVVAPIRVGLKFLPVGKHRPTPVGVAQEDADQSPGDLPGHIIEMHLAARARGTFHLERIAEIGVVDKERPHNNQIDRHPDGPAPVRVPSEHARVRIAGQVIHFVFPALDVKNTDAQDGGVKAPGFREDPGTPFHPASPPGYGAIGRDSLAL